MIAGGFVLYQKGRTLWYLALILIPGLGLLIAPLTWLLLPNVSCQKAPVDSRPESVLDTAHQAEQPKKKVNANLVGCIVVIVLALLYLGYCLATCSG